ncbi:MAG: hypothetical protein V3T32_08420 [Thermodesulfobacteriota bacterium]
MSKFKGTFIVVISILVIATLSIDYAYSRGGRGGGRGGGGHASKSSPARSGSMSNNRASSQTSTRQGSSNRSQNRSSNQENRQDNSGNRQDYRDDSRGDRQDYADDAREDRQDYYDDNYRHGPGHYYYDDNDWARAFAAGAIVAAGTAVAVSAFQSTDCPSSQTMVGDIAYYQCGSTWYTKGYQSGDVVYIAAAPPPGY